MKAGVSVPALIVSDDRVATADGALVAVMVYVWMVTPSEAVTTTEMGFDPTDKGIDPDNDPEVTAEPFTFMVAPAPLAVGLTKTEATPLASDTA